MNVREGVIPLPDHLLTCGCPDAERGWHLSTCVPAREHDEDRERFKAHPQGTRFQGIRWIYPMRISTRVNYEIEVDPVAFIAKHRKAYDEFEMERGYEEWEKPMVFITNMIEDDIGALGGGWFGWPNHISHSTIDVSDHDEHPRWTPELAAQIPPPAPEPPIIDPNQGDLLDGL